MTVKTEKQLNLAYSKNQKNKQKFGGMPCILLHFWILRKILRKYDMHMLYFGSTVFEI